MPFIENLFSYIFFLQYLFTKKKLPDPIITMPLLLIPDCNRCYYNNGNCKDGPGHGYFPEKYRYECDYCFKLLKLCKCTFVCK